MRRREFFALMGGTAAVLSGCPLAARAQQKVPTVGFLGTSTAAAWGPWTAALTQRLRELGWIEGRTIKIEYRWGTASAERYAKVAAEFVRLNVDVIVTAGATVPVLRRATSAIPIVFALDGDPVGAGLVASLARPGGNVTGLSTQTSDIASKRLGYLREVVPGLRRVAVMANAGHPPAVAEMANVVTAAGILSIETTRLEIRRVEDIAPAIDAIKDTAQALYLCGDPLANANGARISTLTLGARLPMISPFRSSLEAGGLISYGPNNADLFRRAGDYVDKILRGANPADLPVEQPTKFELAFNLVAAKALGLTLPPTLLARADEVIE